MLRSVLAVLFVALLPTSDSKTGWLPSSHPGLSLMVEQSLKSDCIVECTRYLLVLDYRMKGPLTDEGERVFQTLTSVGCLDVVLPSWKSFVCKLPGSLSGTKAGQQFATMRFRIKRPQLQALMHDQATLFLEDLRFTLPGATRSAIAQFMRNGEPQVTVGPLTEPLSAAR